MYILVPSTGHLNLSISIWTKWFFVSRAVLYTEGWLEASLLKRWQLHIPPPVTTQTFFIVILCPLEINIVPCWKSPKTSSKGNTCSSSLQIFLGMNGFNLIKYEMPVKANGLYVNKLAIIWGLEKLNKVSFFFLLQNWGLTQGLPHARQVLCH